MSRIYDNWERLVGATLKREQLWQLCHAHSREPSLTSSPSSSSNFSWPSPLPTLPFDSWKLQNSIHHTLPDIFVNRELLSQDEFNLLLTCPNPPKKLKSGYCWYDKVSGFWGKQGQKPSQVISPHLNVGGPIDAHASNGNTGISINGREITKVEQFMLQSAGVKCRPDTYFWMDENGFCQLEGHNYILGCIWNKVDSYCNNKFTLFRHLPSSDATFLFNFQVKVKLLCSVLSLPFPAKSSNHASGSEQAVPLQNSIQKLLLIGCNGAGTSTIFKQAVEILKLDNKPSNVNIEHVTSSIRLSCLDFSFSELAYNYDDDNTGDLHNSLLRFQLIRLQVKDIEESSTWLPMFEDVQIVLFCVSLTDYDQFSVDDYGNTVNKMLLSKRFFENLVTQPTFDQIGFLLVLNKFDLFEEKIRQVPLSQCDWFDDFYPHNHPKYDIVYPKHLGQVCFHYIAHKFKRLYSALTGRKLYVSLVNSVEPNSIDATLKYAREILKWDDEDSHFSLSGYSSSDSSYLSD